MAQNTYKRQQTSDTKSFRFSIALFNDRKFHLAVGLFLILLSIFLAVSFISYLSAGKADQSVVEAITQTGIRESGQQVQNWFGLIGAFTAHYFIFRWLGIMSLMIPPFLFLLGHRIITKNRIVSLTKTFAFTLFYLLWVSIGVGYFLINADDVSEWGFLSGGVGYEMAILIESLMGWGTPLFLIFLFVVFNMYFFNITQLETVNHFV